MATQSVVFLRGTDAAKPALLATEDGKEYFAYDTGKTYRWNGSTLAWEQKGAAAGIDSSALLKANNLSDVANAGTSRTNLGLGTVATLDVDTDGTLAADSDTKIPSQKAVKTYADQILAAADAMTYKGVIDCSANPNYPAADAGDTYRVSVAGKIGGASGTNVEVGDLLICITDGTASGDQATVGSHWSIAQTNIDGAVVGPASSTDGNLASFSGTSGKIVQDAGVATDTDPALAANSDAKLGTQKAVKTYVDAQIAANIGTGGNSGSGGTYLISGGQVIWQSGLSFLVRAATYVINGTQYSSPETTLTLGAADPTDPRIDVIALDTSSTAVVVAGTASTPASEPVVDPATQLRLTAITVPAGSSTPSGVSEILVYDENAGTPTEWAPTASAGSIVVNSTTNPLSGTYCVRATNAGAGVYVQFVGASAVDITGHSYLQLPIRLAATLNTGRGLYVTLYLAGVRKGAQIKVSAGYYNLDNTNTTSYQYILIPVGAFGLTAGQTIDEVRATVFGGNTSWGMDVVRWVQNGSSGGSTTGITQDEADARYLQRANNLSDVTSAAAATAALDAMVGDSGSGGTKGMVPAPAAGDATKFLRGDATWQTVSTKMHVLLAEPRLTPSDGTRYIVCILPYADDGSSITWDFLRATFACETAPSGASAELDIQKYHAAAWSTILTAPMDITSGNTSATDVTSFGIASAVSGDMIAWVANAASGSDFWIVQLTMVEQ